MSIVHTTNRNFLIALREFDENGRKGVILPKISDSGHPYFEVARASDALSKKSKDACSAALTKMGQALDRPSAQDLIYGLDTILLGNPKLKEIRAKLTLSPAEVQSAIDSGIPLYQARVSKLTLSEMALLCTEFRTAQTSAIAAAKKNLEVVESFKERVGGRQGAEQLLTELVSLTPGNLHISYEQRQVLEVINCKVLVEFLNEKHPELHLDYTKILKINTLPEPEKGALQKVYQDARNKITLRDAQEINRRLKLAGVPDFQMAKNPAIEGLYLQKAAQKGPINAQIQYKAKMAAMIFPTLENLDKAGKIVAGKPIHIVQPGNNDIRNNMHVDIVKELISEWLQEHKPGVIVPINIHILGKGGHPTTGAFVANIEVLTPLEKSNLIKEALVKGYKPEVILRDLTSKVKDLSSPEARAAAKEIFDSPSLSCAEKIDALLENDLTRAIFDKVGNMIGDPAKGEAPLYLFKGVSEAETHGALLRSQGGQETPYTLVLEPNSKHTGENVEFYVNKSIALGEKPVVFVLDASRVGRQVVTFTNQMVDKSKTKVQNWSDVVSPLVDTPASHYAQAYNEEQLFADTTSLFAELARNVEYSTRLSFVDGAPVDDRLYPLLAQYTQRIHRANASAPTKTLDQIMDTPVSEIMGAVGKEFVALEDTIPAGHVQQEHPQQLAKLYEQQKARKLLVAPGQAYDQVADAQVAAQAAGAGITPALRIPISKEKLKTLVAKSSHKPDALTTRILERLDI